LAIKENEGIRFAENKDNHHIEIFKVKDKKGNTKWDGEVITTLDAMKRLSKKDKAGQRLSPYKRSHANDPDFIFSLAKNEAVIMKDETILALLQNIKKTEVIR
jgi:hypothetical protein